MKDLATKQGQNGIPKAPDTKTTASDVPPPPPDNNAAKALQEQQAAADQTENLELPEAERSYLWDVEHHGNLLVKYGFGPLAEALKRADGAALSRLLAAHFPGSDPRER